MPAGTVRSVNIMFIIEVAFSLSFQNMEQITHQLAAHHPLMQNLQNHQNNHQTNHPGHPNGMVPPASPTDSMEDISKTNLIINYLPQEMNQEEIKELFGKFGEIESCKLVKDKLTGNCHVFLNYFFHQGFLPFFNPYFVLSIYCAVVFLFVFVYFYFWSYGHYQSFIKKQFHSRRKENHTLGKKRGNRKE